MFEQLSITKPALINRPLSEGMIVFASGMNRLTDIHGALSAGVPIGADVSKLSQASIRAIIESRLPVLLDSGAFSEVATFDGRIRVVRTICDREWRRRLGVYLHIAKGVQQTGNGKISRVAVVAPDRVGSQELTLLRLSKFRQEVKEIHSSGAEVLVPLQCGLLGAVEFFKAARNALDIEIVPAFPMKKAATTIQTILDFLKQVDIPRIHLLGMGANNRNAKTLVRLVRHVRPGVNISMDANRIRAALGAQRAITQKEAQYCDESLSGWSGEVDLREWNGELHDMTEALFQPSVWLKGAELDRTADSLTWLTEQQRGAFVREPDVFVNADENQSDWLYQTLMDRYLAYVRSKSRIAARTRAVSEVLSTSQIAYQTK